MEQKPNFNKENPNPGSKVVMAEKVLHLLPVENADGTCTYTFFSVGDCGEVIVERIEGAKFPTVQLPCAVYLDTSINVQAFIASITAPRPASSAPTAERAEGESDSQSDASRNLLALQREFEKLYINHNEPRCPEPMQPNEAAALSMGPGNNIPDGVIRDSAAIVHDWHSSCTRDSRRTE